MHFLQPGKRKKNVGARGSRRREKPVCLQRGAEQDGAIVSDEWWVGVNGEIVNGEWSMVNFETFTFASI